MPRRIRYLLLLGLFALGATLIPAGCEVSDDDALLIGTEAIPIRMYFVPSSKDSSELATHVGKLVDAMRRETGYAIVSTIPQADTVVVEGFSSGDVHVAFMGPKGYAEAYQRGGRIRLIALRYGARFYRSAIYVQQNSDIRTLADCAHRSFSYRDVTSTSGYVFPMLTFSTANVELGVMKGGGTQRDMINNVYEGRIDISAGYFSPPVISSPPGISLDGSEPDDHGNTHLTNGMVVTQAGELLDANGQRVPDAVVIMKDARQESAAQYPDVFRRVRILHLTPKIPNDGVVFHARLPVLVARKLATALREWSRTPEGGAALNGMYNINELDDTT
ncbi:MAG: PhnD/SsuA/transferrin family substrate-binding protein, partial [Planctomycetota bacterium]